MNLVFLSWVVFLLPISILLFDGGATQSIYYQIGIGCQAIALILYPLAGAVARPRATTLLAMAGLALMYLANTGLNVNSLGYLAFLPFLSLAIPASASKSAARLMLLVFCALVILQGLLVGYEAYPNSDKDVLLLWNPNVFWHHATMLLVLRVYAERRIPMGWLAAYALGCAAFGFSRGAVLLLVMALLLHLMRVRPKLVTAVSGLLIVAFVALSVAVVVAPVEIATNLADFDELLSGRLSVAFEAPEIAGADTSTISDTPVIDVLLWGQPVLFAIGFFAALMALRRQLDVLILFLAAFLMDSTIYAPIIAFIYFQLFRLGTERNGTMTQAPQRSRPPDPERPRRGPAPLEVVLNGKFLSQRVTGVQRYGRQILQAFDSLLAEPAFRSVVSMQLLVPPNAADVPELKNIRVRQTGRLRGHLWEQLWLPLQCAARPLLSLSGSAPWFKRRQYATLHDAVLYEFPQAYSLAFRVWYRALFARLGRICPRLFTVSEFSRDRLAHFLPAARDRLVVAYNGHEHFEAVSPEPDILSRLNLAPQRFFLVVGSLNPNKNLPRLARVAAQHLATAPIQFVVVGDANPAVFSSDSVAELPVNFVRAGYLNDGELKALYMNAKALVFPSLYEGFGIPLLEAMAVGCPILASNAASIPEVCGSYATYFDPSDESDIARCLQAAIDAPRSGDKRSARIPTDRLDIFSWRRSAAVILEAMVRAEQATSPNIPNAP